MALEYDTIKASVKALAEAYHLSEDTAEDILKEALAKGYRKHINVSDVMVRVELDDKNKKIRMYHQKKVVPGDPEDDELEISLEEAQKSQPSILIGDMFEEEIPNATTITEFGRGDVALVKNVLRQKTREAQKQEIYDKYIDQVGEMVTGTVDKVEERFVIVHLDGADATMPHRYQMPQEYYREGDRIRVIIAEVNKDTRGSQILVSRADKNLVRRLFEQEVPEIYQGIVEIRAIAREAGERTKMAVSSNNPQVDPIGACIGPRGSRVQVVIDELKGEKIEVFEWSDNLEELIRNALSPAIIQAVIPGDEEGKSLIVVVDDDQLSLAIGRRGSNVRLAVSLVNKKIDIKSVSTLEQEGIDWQTIAAQERAKIAQKRLDEEREKEARLAEAKAQREAQEKIMEEAAKEAAQREKEQQEAMAREEEAPAMEEKEAAEPGQEQPAEPEQPEQVPLFSEEKPAEKEKPKRKKKVHVAGDYVSKFEFLADAKSASAQEEARPKRRKYKKSDEEEHRLSYQDMKDLLKNKDYEEYRPAYSEEELAQIEEEEQQEEREKYDEDIDYDEYDKYYDEGEDN